MKLVNEGPVGSVHGHEVIHMVIEKPCTKDELKQRIINTYGEQVQFHTCSAQHMTPDQIIEFLEKRGKFIHKNGQLQSNPDRICHH